MVPRGSAPSLSVYSIVRVHAALGSTYSGTHGVQVPVLVGMGWSPNLLPVPRSTLCTVLEVTEMLPGNQQYNTMEVHVLGWGLGYRFPGY